MEYQAEKKEKDDQEETEMSRDTGIVLLNGSDCLVISIC